MLVESLVFDWLTLTVAELVAVAYPVLMSLLDVASGLAPAVGVGAGGLLRQLRLRPLGAPQAEASPPLASASDS